MSLTNWIQAMPWQTAHLLDYSFATQYRQMTWKSAALLEYTFTTSQEIRFLSYTTPLHCTFRNFQEIRVLSYGFDCIHYDQSLTIKMLRQHMLLNMFRSGTKVSQSTLLIFTNIICLHSVRYIARRFKGDDIVIQSASNWWIIWGALSTDDLKRITMASRSLHRLCHGLSTWHHTECLLESNRGCEDCSCARDKLTRARDWAHAASQQCHANTLRWSNPRSKRLWQRRLI